MHELQKAIEGVLRSTSGDDDVLVTSEELRKMHAKPDEDLTVNCTFVETEALDHLREVYEGVKGRL